MGSYTAERSRVVVFWYDSAGCILSSDDLRLHQGFCISIFGQRCNEEGASTQAERQGQPNLANLLGVQETVRGTNASRGVVINPHGTLFKM